jgi:DNA-binding PucR family transcriptional regulator
MTVVMIGNPNVGKSLVLNRLTGSNFIVSNYAGTSLELSEANEGVLLPTLRILLDNCFNWKKTAQQMYVHVNTLHYRIKKVEQLMQIDLSQMENRVNTFLAIKLYDLMQFNKALN